MADDLAWVHLPFLTSPIKWRDGSPLADTPTGLVSQGPRVLISPTLNRLDARLLADQDGTYFTPLGAGAPIPYDVTPVTPVDDPMATGSYSLDLCDPGSSSCNPARDILHGHGGLKQIADAGMVFTRFYATSTVCSPTRASLMTGRHGFKTGATNFEDHLKLTDYYNDKTIAKYLKEETCGPGKAPPCYTTGLIGKWHVTAENPWDPDPMSGYVATHLGFDEVIADNESQRGYFSTNPLGCYPENLLLNASGADPDGPGPVPPSAPPGSDLGGCLNGAYIVQGGRSGCDADDSPAQGGVDKCSLSVRVYGDLAENFIDRHHDETFFLVVPFNVVHDPHSAPARTYTHYTTEGAAGREKGNRARGGGKHYWALIEEMDAAIGRVLDRLAAWGLTDETLVIFTGDQGQDGGAANWGEPALKGAKTDVEEGGIRVPFIASACGGSCDLSQGHSCRTDRVGSHVDILRTIAHAAGIEAALPGSGVNYEVEGRSLWTAINNKNASEGTARNFAFAAEQLNVTKLNGVKVAVTTSSGYATKATFSNDTTKNTTNTPNGICGYEGPPISDPAQQHQHRLRGSSCKGCDPTQPVATQCPASTPRTCKILGGRCVTDPLAAPSPTAPRCSKTGQCAPGETCRKDLTIDCNVCRPPAWKLIGRLDANGMVKEPLGLWNLDTDPEEQIDCKEQPPNGLPEVRAELECTLNLWWADVVSEQQFFPLENGKLSVGAGKSCRQPL